jgi:uncharacterized protein DUF559
MTSSRSLKHLRMTAIAFGDPGTASRSAATSSRFRLCAIARSISAGCECDARSIWRSAHPGGQHLADPVAYRRDRRKDQLLQENGYLVLRYLAEDLGKQLDAVLDGILRAVSSRQKSPVVTNTVTFWRGSRAR